MTSPASNEQQQYPDPYIPYQPPPVQYVYVQAPPADNAGMATAAVLFAFLMPIVGLILGVIVAAKAPAPGMPSRQGTGAFAIVLSMIMFVVWWVMINAGAL